LKQSKGLTSGPPGILNSNRNPYFTKLDSIQMLAFKVWKKFWKYLAIDHESRNNFDYWNFLKFEMEIELKFMEARSVLKFSDLIQIPRDFEN
jgi:hypothetical protein